MDCKKYAYQHRTRQMLWWPTILLHEWFTNKIHVCCKQTIQIIEGIMIHGRHRVSLSLAPLIVSQWDISKHPNLFIASFKYQYSFALVLFGLGFLIALVSSVFSFFMKFVMFNLWLKFKLSLRYLPALTLKCIDVNPARSKVYAYINLTKMDILKHVQPK